MLLCGLSYEANGFKSCLLLSCSCGFLSPVSIAITSLGEERANLCVFHTIVRFELVWILGSDPGFSLTLCCFVVYSTRLFVSCLIFCPFVLVFFSPFSIAITSLGEERANLSALRTFVRFVLAWICRLPLPLSVWEGLRFVIVALHGLFAYFFFVYFVFLLLPGKGCDLSLPGLFFLPFLTRCTFCSLVLIHTVCLGFTVKILMVIVVYLCSCNCLTIS